MAQLNCIKAVLAEKEVVSQDIAKRSGYSFQMV